MIPGRFYCYYKPTYANGYGQYEGQDIDLNFVQAYDQICRDEFTPINSYLESDDYHKDVNNGLQSQQLSDQILGKAFKRTYDVEFILNTNIKELKQKLKRKEHEKPIMLVACS